MERDANSCINTPSSSTTVSSNRLNCYTCGVYDIHKNDFGNHVKGRSHRKKLREENRKLGEGDDEMFDCKYCKRKYRGKEFYMSHLGTKTHKRNLRKQRLLLQDSEEPTYTWVLPPREEVWETSSDEQEPTKSGSTSLHSLTLRSQSRNITFSTSEKDLTIHSCSSGLRSLSYGDELYELVECQLSKRKKKARGRPRPCSHRKSFGVGRFFSNLFRLKFLRRRRYHSSIDLLPSPLPKRKPIQTSEEDVHPPGTSERKLRKIFDVYREVVSHTDFTRTKYKTRVGKIEDVNYKTYVSSLTAYLTLRLALDQTVEDFSISVNDRAWKVFGDVVISIKHKEEKEKRIVYAIQCRKITQLPRQIDYLEEAKVYIGKQYSYLAQLKDAGKDVNETKFVILTTCSVSSRFDQLVTLKPAILNKWKTTGDDISVEATLKIKSVSKKNELINLTCDPENVYSFTLLDHVPCHLPHLFFYANQRIDPGMINQVLKSKFDRYPDITTEYTKYIENWMDGKLGGNYKLKKRDVVVKIGEILLNPYIIPPKIVYSKYDNNFTIWNHVINKAHLTVVHNEPFIINKVCQPLNVIIEETLCTKIDTVTKSLRVNNDYITDVVEPIKSYFFEVIQDRVNDDIPLHMVYNVFWKAGRIPLLLSTEDNENYNNFILDVISFMKQMGVYKKFLIKSSNLNLNRIKGNNSRIFTCLDDIKDAVYLDDVTIKVTESFELPLDVIQSTDPFFCKWVTPNIFLDMSLSKYSFKPSYSSKHDYNKKDGEALKIILNDDVKDQLESQLYPNKCVSADDSSESGSEDRLRGIHPAIF